MDEADVQGEAELAAFQQRAGVSFRSRALLERALTHKSVQGAPHYERLEFLGDRLLGFIVAEMLYRRFPEENEGVLSVRLAELVSGATLAEVAADLDIGKVLRLDAPLREEGFPKHNALLADVCEALIAALYLDSGMEATRAFLERYWRTRLEHTSSMRDARSLLQEWCQRHKLHLPHYEVTEMIGPAHDPRFTMAVSVPSVQDGESLRASAQARSKKLAMRAAAQALLDKVESR